MRDEARAKRDAEAVCTHFSPYFLRCDSRPSLQKHAFDLQAGPERIQRYEEVLRARHTTARYPNLLGAAFKEMYDRNRARPAAQQ